MQSEHSNRVLGNYELREKLGAGGMGEVYRAVHTRMERVVAVKLLPERLVRDEAAVLRFQQEVKAAARLSHPNVVTAYDADEADGVHFLVMEYVQGIDLQALVQKFGSLTAAEAVDCIVQAARGLEYAHGQGVLHRDIKPANLLFDAGGTVRLLDLGLARFDSDASDEPDAAPLTQTGVIMGTVDYMSPEQADDSHTADARSDIYSLGCTLYYLLVGRPPYSGETMLQRILAHRNQPQPDLPPEIPAAVNTVFRRMIARHPDDRFQSMSEVIAALETCRAQEESLHDTDPLSRLTGITPAGSPAASTPIESHSRDTLNNTSHLQETVVPQPATSPPPGRHHRRWLIALLLLATIVPAVVFLRPDAPMGTLLLQVDDPSAIGAIVTLDEVQQRPFSNEGEHSIEVPADGKPHTLQITRAGFLPLREEITIDAGQTRSIPVRLEKERVAAAQGSTRDNPADLSPTDLLFSDDYAWTEPENLGPRVNGSKFDRSPSLTADGLTMYSEFQRLIKNGNNCDLMVSRRRAPDAPFDRAGTLNVNTIKSDEGPCISGDELELFFTRQRSWPDPQADLLVCRRNSRSDEFGPPKKIELGLNPDAIVRHPAISPDDLTLIFACKQSAASRDFDLYMAARPNRGAFFGPPVPLPTLNSAANERYPRFAPDGRALLFSSSRSPTMGQDDIWIARRRSDGSFAAPVHAGGGINTPDADGSVALSPDGRTAIYHISHDSWHDLWMVRRVPQKDAARYRSPQQQKLSRPEYEEYATGQWIPVLRTQDQLAQVSDAPPAEPMTVAAAEAKGIRIKDGVLELDSRALLLNRLVSRNLIIRATVKKLTGRSLRMPVCWPERQWTSPGFHNSDGEYRTFRSHFAIQHYLDWSADDKRFMHTEFIENASLPIEVSEFEFAVSRVDGYVRAYVDGRLILEAAVPADLGECHPVLSADEGRSRFRNIEVQLLDDDIAEKVELDDAPDASP